MNGEAGRCAPASLHLAQCPVPCRRSWYNHLDPQIKRGPWTEEEDRLIIDMQHRMGIKWAEIADEIPGR